MDYGQSVRCGGKTYFMVFWSLNPALRAFRGPRHHDWADHAARPAPGRDLRGGVPHPAAELLGGVHVQLVPGGAKVEKHLDFGAA